MLQSMGHKELDTTEWTTKAHMGLEMIISKWARRESDGWLNLYRGDSFIPH